MLIHFHILFNAFQSHYLWVISGDHLNVFAVQCVSVTGLLLLSSKDKAFLTGFFLLQLWSWDICSVELSFLRWRSGALAVVGSSFDSEDDSSSMPPVPPLQHCLVMLLRLCFPWKMLAQLPWNKSSQLEREPGLRAGCRSRDCLMGTFINGLVGCLDFPHVWPSQFPVLDLFPSCQIPSFLLFILGLPVWVIDFNYSAWNVPSVCLLEKSPEQCQKDPKFSFSKL